MRFRTVVGGTKLLRELTETERHKLELKKLECENERLTQEILELHAQVRGIYGYRRHTMKLRRDTDKPINHKRILRLMRLAGIQSVIRRKEEVIQEA
ncbi:IS3 family transposase [Paenibacillus lupini]|uniref:IS3 family transposase n=1 Tax=Paenibacillus lupini TaxID=1450204 RepID=UPI0014218DF3|nr:IS3 family transposase [Paenibacillus lupini]NIK22693.1 transposase InsO family protein [Paenibacillus lupini]